jgi:hypothetical protein
VPPVAERSRVDHAPAPQSAGELPAPVCPLGEVLGLGTEGAHSEPPGPGASPLDEGLSRLRTALTEQTPAEKTSADPQGGQT